MNLKITAQAGTWLQPNIENNLTSTGILLGNGETESNTGSAGAVANIATGSNAGPRTRWYIRPRNIAFSYIVRAA